MADLVVDTAELRSAAGELRLVAGAAMDLDGRSGRAMAAVPALGLAGPAQAVDSFLASWVYAVGWIGAQAHEVAGVLAGSAAAFEAVEARLSRGPGEGEIGAMSAPSALEPAPEPRRPVAAARWGLLGSVGSPMPVQLSGARHAGELVVGDPEQVAELARLLDGFADALAEARMSLARVGLGGWAGATATVVVGQLTQLLGRLARAEAAFAAAGSAVGRYSRVHAQARSDAVLALRLWQAGERASEVWRGVVAGVSAAGTVEDPGAADMARAALILDRAREAVEVEGRALVAVLAEAEVGSPKDPGALAGVTRGVASFGAGATQGVVGMAEGMGTLAALGYRVLPVHAIYDPEGYLATWAGLAGGIKYGVEHWDEVGKALVDWETLSSDPARWAGKLAPEVILMVLTVGAAGAARAGKAADKLDSAAAAIQHAQMRGDALFPRVNDSTIAGRLSALRLDPASPAGRATQAQLQAPFGNPDQWLNLPVRDGQRIAVGGPGSSSGFGVPVTGEIGVGSRAWFEALQMPPLRTVGPGDAVPSPPTFPGMVRVYEVRGGDLDAAHSVALANPQFGAGGAGQVFIPDVNDAIRDGRLVRVDQHHFDAETRRATFEDPAYRQVDPTLPERALDADRERTLGQKEKAGEETGRAVAGAAGSGLYDRLDAAGEMAGHEPEITIPKERDEQPT